MKTHKTQYPQQYQHPLCGKRVRLNTDDGVTFTVERVVNTRFGKLVPVPGNPKLAYHIDQFEVLA